MIHDSWFDESQKYDFRNTFPWYHITQRELSQIQYCGNIHFLILIFLYCLDKNIILFSYIVWIKKNHLIFLYCLDKKSSYIVLGHQWVATPRCPKHRGVVFSRFQSFSVLFCFDLDHQFHATVFKATLKAKTINLYQ